jgi:signal transduction histidine kinase
MSETLDLNLRELPFPTFNKIAIVVINFIVFSLIITVLNHNKIKDKKTQVFVLMGISILAWIDFAYLARIFGNNHALSIILLKIAWFATPLVFFFTYMTSTLLTSGEKHNKIITYSLLAIALILSFVTLFTNITIDGLKYTNDILDIIYGQGFYPYLGGVFVMMFFTLAPLLKKKLESRIKFFLFGVTIFCTMNMIFNIALPVFFHITNLYFLGDYSTIFLLGFTIYSIFRHALFDIRVFTTELLTIAIWTILFVKIFFSRNLGEVGIDAFVFVLTIAFGILLIRSVRNEIKQKEKLLELSEKLEDLDKRKDEFLSVAAHELRAPMTAIKGYLSMVIEGDGGKLTPQDEDFIKEAINGNERLIRLVNNLLNISRIEEGRLTFEMGDVHLIEVAKIVRDDYKSQAEEKGLKFEIEIHGLKDNVYVDKDRVFEVISNLVSNAIKYTDKGSVTIRITNPSSEKIRLEVIDTGPGISEEDSKRLFEKFYRANASTGKVLGTGLGLYISKLLVEKFKGKIGFKSEVGKGSTFWFELPIKTSQDMHTVYESSTKYAVRVGSTG